MSIPICDAVPLLTRTGIRQPGWISLSNFDGESRENRKSLSLTWKKAFEEEYDALSSHSSDPEGQEDPRDPNGKTLEGMVH